MATRPYSPFALLLSRTGMSQQECAMFLEDQLKVPVSRHTVESYASRRNAPTPPADIMDVMFKAVAAVQVAALAYAEQAREDRSYEIVIDPRNGLQRAAAGEAIAKLKRYDVVVINATEDTWTEGDIDDE
jgi:hypothetical protein